MLNSRLCDYSDVYTLVKGRLTITAAEKQAHEWNIGVIFNNCAPFTDCTSEIYNTQVDNAKDLDAIMLMYNLIEYSDSYLKTSGSLWQYYRDKPNAKSFKS